MIQAKIGASTLSWICPPWNDEQGNYAIEEASKTGFDLIEILLPNTMVFDALNVKKQLKAHNIDAVCGLNLSAEYHIPTHPKEATKLIKWAIDKSYELESPYLGGVLHSAIGVFSGKQRTKEEETILFDVWNEIGHYANQHGITVGIEPINRYESYVCTGAEETLDLINRSGASNVGLHLDTFHMNIEEQSFYTPIIKAGKQLKHIHMTENDRGLLGEGLIDWDTLFKALNEINFTGNLVLENFSNSVPHMAETVSLWRPSKHTAQDLASHSLQFIKQKIAQFSN
jgi:D-psicose/D-tagatose/L-ribulose 3-epimerase